MKLAELVCPTALLLITGLSAGAAAQTPAMTKGISVQMAATKNAMPYPEADNADAWIVAVTADGRLYFGTKPVTPDQLLEEMKVTPRHRDQNLYIKADSQSPFTSVEKVLDVARAGLFDSVVLLSRSDSPALGKLVSPKGLEISLKNPVPDTPILKMSKMGESVPELKLNNQDVHSADLQRALNQLLQSREQREVLLKTDPALRFAQVVQIIDLCASVKARVAMQAATQ